MKENILKENQHLVVTQSTTGKLIGYTIQETVTEHTTIKLCGKKFKEMNVDTIRPLGADVFRLSNSNYNITVKLV